MAARRPDSRPPPAGRPVRNPRQPDLDAMADRVIYVGSHKHKKGMYQGRIGDPGSRPTTVEQARVSPPAKPFTMLCPAKWNQLVPWEEATTLLRAAIRCGQIGHPIKDGLPEYVWARDPDDPSIVYEARRLSFPENGYKAYPLIEPQILELGIQLR